MRFRTDARSLALPGDCQCRAASGSAVATRASRNTRQRPAQAPARVRRVAALSALTRLHDGEDRRDARGADANHVQRSDRAAGQAASGRHRHRRQISRLPGARTGRRGGLRRRCRPRNGRQGRSSRAATSRKGPFQIYADHQFIDALYPWLEPSTAPANAQGFSTFLARPGVAERVSTMGVRFIVWIDGVTQKTDGGGSIACAAGPAAPVASAWAGGRSTRTTRRRSGICAMASARARSRPT